MGAKAPSKLKLRRPTFNCDACARKFLSAQALKTHQSCMHKIDDTAAKIAKQTKARAKLTTLLGKAIKKPELTKLKDAVVSKTPVRKKQNNLGEGPSESQSVSDMRTVEFECPQCFQMFTVYFSAYRHIQKYHCTNNKGQKVHPNASDLIKPIRVELCLKCKMRLRPAEAHCCNTAAFDSSVLVCDYACLACKQKFSSMQMFDVHVSGIHCNDIDSMFFPEMSQFQSWKEHMEKVTNSKYSLFGKWHTKQSYRCAFIASKEKAEESENVSYFCPSSIILTEYTKGVQVHYYKEHYGHTCNKYKLADTFKKYSISSFVPGCSAIDSINASEKEVDFYARFKKLMDCIVLDAAKVSIPCLKLLVSRALEMSTMINLYLEDGKYEPSSNVDNRSMTDDEISRALETFIQSRIKRRSTDSLESNNDSDAPVIINTFSMAENEPSKKKPKLAKESPINKIQSPSLGSSFNDSYKDFVDKNFIKPAVDENTPEVKRKSNMRNNKVTIEVEDTELKRKSNFRPGKIEIESKIVNIKSDNKLDATPKNDISSISETRSAKKNVIIKDDKDDDDDALDTKKVRTEKKKVMKTKIGQFKPSLSPKTSEKEVSIPVKKEIMPGKKEIISVKKESIPAKKESIPAKKESISAKKESIPAKKESIPAKKESIPGKKNMLPGKKESRRSIDLASLKVDFEYEVKEQENDCNILILKI